MDCTLYPPLHIQAKFLQGHSFTYYAIEMVTVEFLLQVGGLYPTEGIHDCTEEIIKVRYITEVNSLSGKPFTDSGLNPSYTMLK